MAFAQEVLDYSEYTLASLAAVQTDDLKRAELTLALRTAQSAEQVPGADQEGHGDRTGDAQSAESHPIG